MYYGDGKGGFSQAFLEQQFNGFPREVMIGRPIAGQRPTLFLAASIVSATIPLASTGEVYLYEQPTTRTFVRSGISVKPFSFSAAPSAIMLAPMDKDANLDLLVLSYNTFDFTSTMSGSVVWFRGTGTPGSLFTNPTTLDVGALSVPVAFSAYSKAGDPVDLAVVTSYDPSSGAGPGNLRLLQNDGNGIMTALPVIPLSGLAPAVIAGDFDGNGEIDLAIPSPVNKLKAPSDKLDLIWNPRQTPSLQTFTAGNMMSGVAMDLLQNGRLDLVSVVGSSADQPSRIGFLYGSDGKPVFRSLPAPQIPAGGPGRALLTVADFNEDGRPDLVLSSTGAVTDTLGQSGLVEMYLGSN